MSKTVVIFDGEVHIVPDGGSMEITAHETPIIIRVVADIRGAGLIKDPQIIEEFDENTYKVWKFKKNPFP